uniref:Small ribosomal subunit protein uS9c n=1 Tax=Euglenaformis proxima TaxID=299110 RepID=A0A023HI12_9EUGL|nr:ribosomal protein S9 [Euglenaformis proxima]AGL12024.1 ribosomal protein S9 [Euglenaformis proxima]
MIKFMNSFGKRKSAVAHVMLVEGQGNIIINGRTLFEYVQNNPLRVFYVLSPLILLKLEKCYDLIVKVKGGGLAGQVDAIKLGISRGFYKIGDSVIQRTLQVNSFLTRDARRKERKKYGLRKARKAPQYSKR